MDPRILGTSASSTRVLHAQKLSEILGRADRSEPIWEDTVWKDKKARTMRYQLKHGLVIRMTFVPVMGHSLVKAQLEMSRKGPDGEIIDRQTMDAEPKQHGKNRIWFPSKLLIECTSDGKVIEKSTLKITEVAFNEPVPADTFKLISMDIPKNMRVHMVLPNIQGTHIWDGKKIVEEKTDFKAMYPDLPPETERRSAWMPYLAVGLAAMGILAFAIYFFRSKRKNA